MDEYEYPEEIKVYLDDIDITYYIFGTDTFNPSETDYYWHDIDISTFIDSAGVHKITVVATGLDSEGRVDCRVEIQ